jgi:tRNA(fMet)-specific endonuclease VapC
MAQFLLDTNIISHLLRHPRGAAGARIALVGDSRICTSIIVAAELRYGTAKKGSTRLAAEVEAVLSRISVRPVEAPTDTLYRTLRAYLESTGRVIGGNDLLIAAHAMALNCTLVTNNDREFSRIPGLAVENWLA